MMISHLNHAPRFALRQLCMAVKSKVADDIMRSSDAALASLRIDPSTYSCKTAFRNDYLLSAYLSKWKGLRTGIDTEAVALSNFAVAEDTCRATNVRLKKGFPNLHDPVLHRAQRLIAKLLGTLDVSSLASSGSWGPGATFELSRKRAYLDTKIAEFPITVTREAAPYLSFAIADDLHWSYVLLGFMPSGPYSVLPSQFSFVEGCRVVTVPKNAKTDRTIGVEPRGNMFLQKGVGSFIRSRLKRVGVDLDDQSINQVLAAQAQECGLSTIDLSMASDTLSRELVFDLLPFEWASYLDRLRSKSYTLSDGFHRFEKFSSMGNGFTFELESLIFWSLVRATVDDESTIEDVPFACAVYGDDIILPVQHAHALISVLSYVGFTTNLDKTFIEGRFFESCGRHYFDGEDVTPIYQKEDVSDLTSHIRYYNRIYRYAAKHNDGDAILGIISGFLPKLDKKFRHERHPQIPLGSEGNDGYLSNHRQARPVKVCENHGWKWQVVRSIPAQLPGNEEALYAFALRQGVKCDLPTYGNVTSRDDSSVLPSLGSRWIHPAWEFALD